MPLDRIDGERSPERYSVGELFDELEGSAYPTYAEFIGAVADTMNRHTADFPAQYRPQDAIEWAFENGRLGVEAGKGIVVTGAEREAA